MGDVGDYWNDHREFKRAARSMWAECPSASCQFGGNPVKVAPGCNCRHCGWTAPGKRGSDVEYARKDEATRAFEAEWAAKKKAENARKRQAESTCKACGKNFTTPQGRKSHEKDKHGMHGGSKTYLAEQAELQGPELTREL